MDSRFMYLLEANVLLVLLTGFYLLIRNQLSFRQRRFSLLAIPVLAAIVFIGRSTGISETNALYTLPVYELNALSDPSIVDWQERQLTFWPSCDRIYALGVGVMLVLLLYRIRRVLYKLHRAKRTTIEGIHVVHLENETCFSFFNYVQLNPGLSEAEQQIILEHEKIHISQKHSYDNLLMELVHVSAWFNPAVILLKKELINVHEYEVDQIMYSNYKTNYMEFLLNYSLGTNLTPHLLTNQFYSKNKLIKRLNFMKTKTKSNWAFALTLPLVAASFALVSWTTKENEPQAPPVLTTNKLVQGEIEKMPEFKGGQEALVAYLTENITYPEAAREGKIEGSVFISFLVEASGKISKCAVKKSVHPDLDAEALRVVSAMPDWIPGEKNGKVVNAEMILPISFKL